MHSILQVETLRITKTQLADARESLEGTLIRLDNLDTLDTAAPRLIN